jgi:hypothetical protein
MCGCKCLRKEEMGGGRLHKEGGVRGRAARVMGVSGPKQDLRPNTPTRRLPTPMQAPNQRNSTALLVNVFPQIPNSQNATTEREKKNKKNTLQLLFFANRVSQNCPCTVALSDDYWSLPLRCLVVAPLVRRTVRWHTGQFGQL